MAVTGRDPDDIRYQGEYLDALRFVRAEFDDPLDDVWFAWSEAKAKALAALVVDALKVAAAASGRTGEAEAEAYVSGILDGLIIQAMERGG